jgi:hypothetical protein
MVNYNKGPLCLFVEGAVVCPTLYNYCNKILSHTYWAEIHQFNQISIVDRCVYSCIRRTVGY